MKAIVIAGTDTDVGKTVFAAALAGALGAYYWKPVQAGGLEDGGDAGRVADLSGLSGDRILPNVHALRTPCSPDLAAQIDGVEIDPARLQPPPCPGGTLVIEGAGGVLSPAARDVPFADLFARWGHPVVLVARTGLGTINHSLLAIEALRARGVPILGIVFSGEAAEHSEATIARMGRVKRLGRLPPLDPLTPAALSAAFAENFTAEDFA